ncbi:hypothetical protein MR857_05745 [bacterium]|nr:hypothetical protein [bacterium]MDY3023275.1 hypothetical protein [Oliverpabstia sp.]
MLENVYYHKDTDIIVEVENENHENDCTFFIKGKNLEIIGKEHLRIPSLAHV